MCSIINGLWVFKWRAGVKIGLFLLHVHPLPFPQSLNSYGFSHFEEKYDIKKQCGRIPRGLEKKSEGPEALLGPQAIPPFSPFLLALASRDIAGPLLSLLTSAYIWIFLSGNWKQNSYSSMFSIPLIPPSLSSHWLFREVTHSNHTEREENSLYSEEIIISVSVTCHGARPALP